MALVARRHAARARRAARAAPVDVRADPARLRRRRLRPRRDRDARRATSRSATSSRRRVRSSSRWCTSPTGSGSRTSNAPRLLPVLAGIVVTLAVYSIGVQTMDRGRALLAAGLAAVSGVLLWTTGPLTGDGPAAAFATTARRGRGRLPDATVAGGRVIAITLLAGRRGLDEEPARRPRPARRVGPRRHPPPVAPRRARPGRRARGGGRALGAVGHPARPRRLRPLPPRQDGEPQAGRQLLQALAHLLRARHVPHACSPLRRRRDRALAPLRPRPAGARPRRRLRRGRRPDPTRFLWWWAGVAFVVLLLQDPMFRNHLAALVAPAALLVARYRPSWRVVAVAGLVTLPFQAVTLRPLLLPHDYTGRTAEVVDALRALPPDAWALSDEPGLVWRAGHAHRSVLRRRVGAAHRQPRGADPHHRGPRRARPPSSPRVCAVVITSPERFGSWPDLPDRLEQLGYQRTVELDRRATASWVRRHGSGATHEPRHARQRSSWASSPCWSGCPRSSRRSPSASTTASSRCR